MTRNLRELELFPGLDVLRDECFGFHGVAPEVCRLLFVVGVLRESELLVLKQVGISVGVGFDDDFAGGGCADDCKQRQKL